MTETKITKVKYIIQYYLKELETWKASDWNKGVKYSKDLGNMLELLSKARDTDAYCVGLTGIQPKPYRLIKQTHSITTEAIDE